MLKKVGILANGGDVSGFNAVIRAIVKTAENHGVECYGIVDGYNGLLKKDFEKLSTAANGEAVGILPKGGSIIGSSTNANIFNYKIVNEDGSVTKVKMKDEITKVDISKVDSTTGKEIEGAKLTLKDKETGEVVESWTSGKEPHRIEGLTVSKTYVLHEDLAPAGYNVASNVEFTISDTGEVQKVVMKDEAKLVVKTGDDTDYKSLSALLIASGLLIAAVICKIKRGKDE